MTSTCVSPATQQTLLYGGSLFHLIVYRNVHIKQAYSVTERVSFFYCSDTSNVICQQSWGSVGLHCNIRVDFAMKVFTHKKIYNRVYTVFSWTLVSLGIRLLVCCACDQLDRGYCTPCVPFLLPPCGMTWRLRRRAASLYQSDGRPAYYYFISIHRHIILRPPQLHTNINGKLLSLIE